MALKDKATLSNDKNTSFPDNTTGDITPLDLRDQQQDIIDSNLNLAPGGPTQTAASLVNYTGGLQVGGFNVYGSAKQIIVNTASDLPAAVSNVRTLADDTLYIIAAHINIGSDRIVYGINSEIRGYNTSISSITSTTTAALITCNDKFMRLSYVFLSASLSSKLIDFTGSVNSAFIITRVDSTSFVNVGTFNNTHSGLMTSCNFIGGTSGINFTGTGTGDAAFEDNRFLSYTGTAYDLGTAVFDTIEFNRNKFSGLGGSTSINGAAASANITNRGILKNNSFNGAGSGVTGISVYDLKWTSEDNFNLPDSVADAGFFVDNNGTATTIAVANTPVKINTGGLMTAYINNRFTVAANGDITYIGLEDIDIIAPCNIFLDTASGTNIVYHVYVAKNGTVIPGSKMQIDLDAADPQPLNVNAIISLSTNDVISYWVEAIGHTTDITAVHMSGVIR